jgi:N-methylhydantoinase A
MKLATDIGGTFTDLVYLDGSHGRLGLAKAPSTPPGFARGIMDAIAKANINTAAVEDFVHGTTVVINVLTERKGAVVALLTTEGCRDVLEIGRANRPDIYNLRFRKQFAFVPRHLRLEIEERMDYLGRVVTPLDSAALEPSAVRIEAAGAEAVAVCFLHAYANPKHEDEAAAFLRSRLPGVFVTTSSELTREWREYERASTVVLNAYVAPTASAYLHNLEAGLREIGVASGLEVMKSNGGTQTFAFSEQQPIHMVESGPVGGVIGAAAIGKAIGTANLITLDIGGTTAKCSLVQNGAVRISTDYRIERDQFNAGYPIKAPVVDIVEIGAGGGSIAWIDSGGALKVGPRSAGAVPGPACYGMGGSDPTVTDANLVAGRLNPDYFLGGELGVDVDRARKAIQPIASHLDVGVDEAALGIIRIANANMINALKLVSVRRGHDPREFALIAFGGGGGMHATALARELHMGTVLIPQAPGHFSAWGMLMTDPMQDFIQTYLIACVPENRSVIEERFDVLGGEAVTFFQRHRSVGDIRVNRSLDMRYAGQEHTVEVPVDDGLVDVEAVNERFHGLHEQAYTFRLESPTQIVNFRVVGIVPTVKAVIAAPESGDGLPKSERSVNFDEWGQMTAPIFERSSLRAGVPIEGPAVIEEPASTTLVYPDQRVMLDEIGNLRIDIARHDDGNEVRG